MEKEWDCGCKFGPCSLAFEHCPEAAQLLERFHNAEDSETRAKAAAAYNKHYGHK